MSWHDDFSYWETLARAWEHHGPLVNVEWDMEYTDALGLALLACPQPLCTHAYRIYTPRNHWAHGWAPADAERRTRGEGIRWITERAEWVDYSAIGFCKIAPEARTGPLARRPWMNVELSVNEATTGLWHVHWPAIDHYHRAPR